MTQAPSNTASRLPRVMLTGLSALALCALGAAPSKSCGPNPGGTGGSGGTDAGGPIHPVCRGNDGPSDAGFSYDPAGNCLPLEVGPVCTPGDAGCVCEWSETMLADGVEDPNLAGFAAVSDGLGGVFVLFRSVRDSLLHATRHDLSSGHWTELPDIPQLESYQLAADGCGHVMVMGVKRSALGTLVNSSFVYDARSGSWCPGRAASMSGDVRKIEMSPRGHAVATFQNAQFASASVLDAQRGTWGSGVDRTPGFIRATAMDGVGNFAAGIDTSSRFTQPMLFIEWYEAQTGTWTDWLNALEITSYGFGPPYPVFDAHGGLHVIWSAPSPSSTGAIWTARVDRPARALVGTHELASTGQASGLQAAGVPQGNAAAVWTRQSIAPGEYCYASPGGCEILATAFDGATETWSAPQVVVTGFSPFLAVAASPTGNAVTAWADYPRQAGGGVTPSKPGVHASYYSPGAGWGAPQTMTSSLPASVDVQTLRVVMNGRGDAFVLWTQLGSAPSPAGSHELRAARRSCSRKP